MLIISGTQLKKRKLGYVAEFCPLCRVIRPFKVSKLGMADHIFFISLGMKNVLGHEGECIVCSNKRSVDGMSYKDFSKKPDGPIETLVKRTFPDIRDAYANRLNLETQLRDGTLGPEDRVTFIQEILQIFNRITEENFHAAFQAKGPGAWLFGANLAIFILLLMVSDHLPIPLEHRDAYVSAFLLSFLSLLFISVVLMFLEPGRTFRNKILHTMAAAFKPLNPGNEELADQLGKMKQAGFKIGLKTKPTKLWNAIVQSRSTDEGFIAPQTGSLREC